MSIAALVLGIVSLVIPFAGLVTGPIAVVLAAVAMRRSLPGRGMAIAGLVTGLIALAGYGSCTALLVAGAAGGA